MSAAFDYSDVSPLPLESAATDKLTVCKIMYSDEYRKTMGLLRALMASNELSERALHMTEEAIELVAAHYTVWQYRYKIVAKLSSAEPSRLEQELQWCGQVAIENEKNYQIWHYRQLVIGLYVERLLGGDKSKYSVEKEEYPIVAEMLKRDAKNYHVWTHRRWIVDTFGLYGSEKELAYTAERIAQDVRNNSAWNHRYLVGGEYGPEVEFAEAAIARCPANPSAWNYVRGVARREGSKKLADLLPLVQKYTSAESRCTPAWELLGEIYREQGDAEKAQAVYERLGTLDPVRANYWRALSERSKGRLR